MNWNAMINRMLRAARLEVSLYEEVEKNEKLTTEAMYAVVLVSVLSGLGAGLEAGRAGAGALVLGLVGGAVLAVVGYLIWAWVAYFVGTRFFGGKADYGELRRTLGYAYAPNALGLLRFVPAVGGLLVAVGSIWSLVAGVVAVRQALDFDTGKAILTVIAGWIVLVVLVAVLGTFLFLGTGAGFGI